MVISLSTFFYSKVLIEKTPKQESDYNTNRKEETLHQFSTVEHWGAIMNTSSGKYCQNAIKGTEKMHLVPQLRNVPTN